MTKGQLLTFSIIANCAFAKMAVCIGALGLIGDPSFQEEKLRFLLVRSYLKTIRCYDPDAENNCLTSDEIFSLVNASMQILGLCGDALGLEESQSDCCDPLDGINVVNS